MNANWSPKDTRSRLLLSLIIVAASLFLTGCPPNQWSTEDSTTSYPQATPYRNKLVVEGGFNNNEFKIEGRSPGPPYPKFMKVVWISPPGTYSSAQASHPHYQTRFTRTPQGGAHVEWSLPVDPVIGNTTDVTASYDPNHDAPRTDSFGASSSLYPNTIGLDVRQGEGGQTGWALASTDAPANTYHVWQAWRRLAPADETEMTLELCQDWAGVLQSERAFFALRFPVLPPPLAYTQPYTLPLLTGGPDDSFALLQDWSAWPPTPVLSAPIEYRPEYHSFLESELPAAPGEHWLAFGLATTPTLDCASVTMPLEEWGFALDLKLDFGGPQDACTGCVLPVYNCYAGQEPPSAFTRLVGASGAGVTSYQGWGVTCLGPHPLRLAEEAPPLELRGTHAAWITPTQTISLGHSLWNWSGDPVTVTLAHSSTLGLPWGIYAGTHTKPYTPLTPIAGPIRLEDRPFPGWIRYFWLIADVPSEAPSGAETLTISATDVSSPANHATNWDLLWVGDWVEPPPYEGELGFRLYLPLVLRQWP